MSRPRSDPERDLDAVVRDDRALDRLAAGDVPSGADPVLRLLHSWRSDLAIDLPVGSGCGGADADTAVLDAVVLDEPVPGDELAKRRPGRHAADRRRRRTGAVAASVAAISIGLSGIVVAASGAEPGSPLWPVTQVVYPEQARSAEAKRDAERALAQARQAAEEGRLDEAQRRASEAEQRAGAVTQEQEARALREEAQRIRRECERRRAGASPGVPPNGPAATPPAQSPGPTPTPSPSRSKKSDDDDDDNGGGGNPRRPSSERRPGNA